MGGWLVGNMATWQHLHTSGANPVCVLACCSSFANLSASECFVYIVLKNCLVFSLQDTRNCSSLLFVLPSRVVINFTSIGEVIKSGLKIEFCGLVT